MDEDHIKGPAKQAAGKFRLVVGNAPGDTKLEADGKADATGGKIQNNDGSLKGSLTK